MCSGGGVLLLQSTGLGQVDVSSTATADAVGFVLELWFDAAALGGGVADWIGSGLVVGVEAAVGAAVAPVA